MTSTITTINPATGANLASYTAWTAEQLEQAVAEGAAAAATWGRVNHWGPGSRPCGV